MTKEPPFKIDDESYQSGREAFTRGATLRTIVEQLAACGADQVAEQKAFSGVLGFGDALLDLLRNPPAIAQLEARIDLAETNASTALIERVRQLTGVEVAR